MALEDSMDPMSELFGGKRERARMAVQLSKQPKVASSMYGQPSSIYFPMCVPPQPFFPNGQQMPFQNLSYDSSKFYPHNSWANMSSPSSFNNMRASNRFGTSKEVVCFLCEGKGHYANECGSRKHMDVPFHGNGARPKHN
ncbi:hypothetical protein C2G38_2041002 [Gigaspora rosea]|uniref:CCHC-type domain-containing protein n=1 Tax=Gigaspora rosea TaxID=44941 RepID=A0A397UW62_9GLOM|nr:hypothetical protein C2G38_2041002 [Gigaspora rosea]